MQHECSHQFMEFGRGLLVWYLSCGIPIDVFRALGCIPLIKPEYHVAMRQASEKDNTMITIQLNCAMKVSVLPFLELNDIGVCLHSAKNMFLEYVIFELFQQPDQVKDNIKVILLDFYRTDQILVIRLIVKVDKSLQGVIQSTLAASIVSLVDR